MLSWKVYIYNINSRSIECYDVFKHAAFLRDVQEQLLKSETIEEFSEEVMKSAKYYFWSRAEYEVTIAGMFTNGEEAIKVDIFKQLYMNWDRFIDYVWASKKEKAAPRTKSGKVKVKVKVKVKEGKEEHI